MFITHYYLILIAIRPLGCPVRLAAASGRNVPPGGRSLSAAPEVTPGGDQGVPHIDHLQIYTGWDPQDS